MSYPVSIVPRFSAGHYEASVPGVVRLLLVGGCSSVRRLLSVYFLRLVVVVVVALVLAESVLKVLDLVEGLALLGRAEHELVPGRDVGARRQLLDLAVLPQVPGRELTVALVPLLHGEVALLRFPGLLVEIRENLDLLVRRRRRLHQGPGWGQGAGVSLGDSGLRRLAPDPATLVLQAALPDDAAPGRSGQLLRSVGVSLGSVEGEATVELHVGIVAATSPLVLLDPDVKVLGRGLEGIAASL